MTVNAICPGLFITEANRARAKTNPEAIETFVPAIPMGRPGDPREIGPLAIYLASPVSSCVTGAAFGIDGGYTLWRSAASDLAAPQLDIRQWVSLNFKESGRWPNGGNKQDSGRTGLLRKT